MINCRPIIMNMEKLRTLAPKSVENLLESDSYPGTLLPILTYPHPTLTSISQPVEVFDSKLKKFCIDLMCTMYNSNGIGLAAPQVGVSQRIFVVDVTYRKKREDPEEKISFKPLIFINPIIKDCEGQTVFREGCLSLPKVYDNVTRYRSCTVNYQDVNGQHHSMKASDLLAICVQHESDHLDGIVFIERIAPEKKDKHINKMAKRKQTSCANN